MRNALLFAATLVLVGCTSPPAGEVPTAGPSVELVELVVDQHWRPSPNFIEGAIAFFEVRTAAGAVVDRQVTVEYTEASTTRVVRPGTYVVLSGIQVCPGGSECLSPTWGEKVLDESSSLCHGTFEVPATTRFTVVFDIDGEKSPVHCRVSTRR